MKPSLPLNNIGLRRKQIQGRRETHVAFVIKSNLPDLPGGGVWYGKAMASGPRPLPTGKLEVVELSQYNSRLYENLNFIVSTAPRKSNLLRAILVFKYKF